MTDIVKAQTGDFPIDGPLIALILLADPVSPLLGWQKVAKLFVIAHGPRIPQRFELLLLLDFWRDLRRQRRFLKRSITATYEAGRLVFDDGRFLKAGVGDGETKAASGFSGVAAIVYFPTVRQATVDTTVVAGPANVNLRWYDPTSGIYTTISESEAGIANRSVTFPKARQDGSTDWVLIVERL
jgi:hypothetical protein